MGAARPCPFLALPPALEFPIVVEKRIQKLFERGFRTGAVESLAEQFIELVFTGGSLVPRAGFEFVARLVNGLKQWVSGHRRPRGGVGRAGRLASAGAHLANAASN